MLFTVPGEQTLPLLDAAFAEGVRIIDARDERGAAAMAAGYAFGSRARGCVVVAGRDGFANAMPSLLDAQADGMPVVCITGVTSDEQTAAAAIARPWASSASAANSAPATGRILRALNGARGVTVIEVSLDEQTATAPNEMPRPEDTPRARDGGDVREALARARRPVLVAGDTCYWRDDGDALTRLVERIRIPVFTTGAARGLIGDDHELCLGGFDDELPAAAHAMREADLVVIVDERAEPTRLESSVLLVPEVADLTALHALDTQEWLKRLHETADAHNAEVARRTAIATWPLHPGRLVAEIAAKMPADGVIVVEGGDLSRWAVDGVRARSSGSLHIGGARGTGTPRAIGIKLACPDRPVLCLTGDGAFASTALEIETSGRHDAPVAVVVANDGGWGRIRRLQLRNHGRSIAADLPVAAYETLADLGGGVGDRVETPRQLAHALTNALVAKVPSVINAVVDRNAVHPRDR